MIIINDLENCRIKEKTAVALGNFDGIHIGHQEIFRNAVTVAKQKGIKSACYTFSNHPLNFILRRDENDDAAVKYICSEKQKIRLLEEMGIDILVNVPFDENVMTMSAQDFIDNVLIDGLNADTICCGFNYTFGKRAMGKPEMLAEQGKEKGFDVIIHDAVKFDGDVVSSTAIREFVRKGDMEMAGNFLGRPFAITGAVIHGKKLGHELGYPTINLPAPLNMIYPPDGVYVSNVYIDDRKFAAVSNIGFKPTVGSDTRSIESYMFDFDGELYGKDLMVELLAPIRPERKFESMEALSAQISEDCAKALEFHKNQ